MAHYACIPTRLTCTLKEEINKNYLREDITDIDKIYSVDESNGSCNIC